MSFLLRLALPNVPGSLGRVASAIGAAGGDIDAIQIVEIGPDGVAIDDVAAPLTSSVMIAMPDLPSLYAPRQFDASGNRHSRGARHTDPVLKTSWIPASRRNDELGDVPQK